MPPIAAGDVPVAVLFFNSDARTSSATLHTNSMMSASFIRLAARGVRKYECGDSKGKVLMIETAP